MCGVMFVRTSLSSVLSGLNESEGESEIVEM